MVSFLLTFFPRVYHCFGFLQESPFFSGFNFDLSLIVKFQYLITSSTFLILYKFLFSPKYFYIFSCYLSRGW